MGFQNANGNVFNCFGNFVIWLWKCFGKIFKICFYETCICPDIRNQSPWNFKSGFLQIILIGKIVFFKHFIMQTLMNSNRYCLTFGLTPKQKPISWFLLKHACTFFEFLDVIIRNYSTCLSCLAIYKKPSSLVLQNEFFLVAG